MPLVFRNPRFASPQVPWLMERWVPYAASVATSIGSTIAASSFSGLLTRVEVFDALWRGAAGRLMHGAEALFSETDPIRYPSVAARETIMAALQSNADEVASRPCRAA